MEGFHAEDRHDPLPHIALLTTALKSAYRNTASLSVRSATELQELRIGADWNGSGPCCSGSFRRAVVLREVCYQIKAPAVGPG